MLVNFFLTYSISRKRNCRSTAQEFWKTHPHLCSQLSPLLLVVKIGLASGSAMMGWNILKKFLAVNSWILSKLYLNCKTSAAKAYYIAFSGSVGINLFPPFSALRHFLIIWGQCHTEQNQSIKLPNCIQSTVLPLTAVNLASNCCNCKNPLFWVFPEK